MNMAAVWRFPLIWVIVIAIYRIDAATLQKSETLDLDESNTKDGEQIGAATYKPANQDHIAINDSKVIIDMYAPQKPLDPKPSEPNKVESGDRIVTPFAQVIINQPDTIESSTAKIHDNTEIPATEKPLTVATATSHLIPPASVNASIAQLEKESKQKQGQIIIRYEFSKILFETLRIYS